MTSALHHIARRGIQMAHEQVRTGSLDGNGKLHIPTWGIHLLGATTAIYFIFVICTSYTYNQVVATLTMIETPTATAIIQTSPTEGTKEDPDAPLLTPEEKAASGLISQELLLVKQKPITAKLRTTIAHLRARAGWFSRFRGAHILALYIFTMQTLLSFSTMFVRRNTISTVLITTGLAVVLARLNTAWVHVIISEPSAKKLAERIPPRSAFKKLAAPSAIHAVISQLTVFVPAHMYYGLGLEGYVHNPAVFKKMSSMQFASVCLATLLLISVTLFLSLGLLFPAHVAYKRVQASLLPEEDEAIVPFDRTFGGKVVPEIVGGSGMLGMRDAWKTFDWNATIRLVKVYVKTFFIQVALFVLFLVAVAVELRLMLGSQVDNILRDGLKNGSF